MHTVLIIGGVSYDATARVANRMHFDGLSRDLRGGYDTVAFSVWGGALDAAPTWAMGTAVSATIDRGAGPVVKFRGEITDLQPGEGPHGWHRAYSCSGLKYQADRIPVTAPDLTGNFVLNRVPTDPFYASADAGLTVGQIFTRALTIPATAVALDAYGIGGYTGLPSAPVLPAATVADLALLTVVPPTPVSLAGESLLNTLDQVLSRYMPKFVFELRPDGIIRCRDTTDLAAFVPRTLTLPSTSGMGDRGVAWPRIRCSSARCATRVLVRGGPMTAVQLLSTADGTLIKAWSAADETAWTYYDFTTPKDAEDDGNVVSITGNSATIHSAHATTTWAANFWSGRQAILYLIDTVATGINVGEHRRVTANDALSGGGNCTVSWDASQPLASNGYNKYRLVGQAGSHLDVGRLFSVREPSTGATALNTYIGAHLQVESPIPIPWANRDKAVQIQAPTAIVVGGVVSTETPVGVEVQPGSGQFRLTQPDASILGQPAQLNKGYPTTTAGGKPTDVRILALYSRGVLQAAAPADVAGVAQYQGTAFTAHNMQVTKTIDVPAYLDQWSQPSMATLAQQHLDALKDVVFEGSGSFYGDPGFDFLEFNYSLNYAIAGTTSPWSSINAPCRGVTLEWPQATGYQWRVTYDFTTARRPFSGDDLYLHPSYTGESVIGQMPGLPGLAAMAGTGPGDITMPVGQDQGDVDYSAGWAGSRRRERAAADPGLMIRPEADSDRRRREAEQAERRPADRSEADAARAAREAAGRRGREDVAARTAARQEAEQQERHDIE